MEEKKIAKIVSKEVSRLKENLTVVIDKSIDKRVKEHSSPSAETLRLIGNIEKSIMENRYERTQSQALIQKDISIIKEYIEKDCRWKSKLEETYAKKKEVERIRNNISWITKLVLGSVVLAILALVIKN